MKKLLRSESKPVDKECSFQNQWILIGDGSAVEQSSDAESEPVFCKLRHPKTEEGAIFLFSNGNQKVFQLFQQKEDYRSWFLGDTVQEDGGLLICTPVDPIFLVLPYLVKAGKPGKYMALDQVVVDDDFPECHRLISCSELTELSWIADVKEADDFVAYKFDQDKCLSWLRLKVENVVETLKSERIHVHPAGSQSAFFSRTAEENAKSEDFVRYACGLVSEYLPQDLAKDLKEYLSISDPDEDTPNLEPPNKKQKTDGAVAPSEDYSKNGGDKYLKSSKGGKLTAAQKKLSKADLSGMASISSFFSPKLKS